MLSCFLQSPSLECACFVEIFGLRVTCEMAMMRCTMERMLGIWVKLYGHASVPKGPFYPNPGNAVTTSTFPPAFFGRRCRLFGQTSLAENSI